MDVVKRVESPILVHLLLIKVVHLTLETVGDAMFGSIRHDLPGLEVVPVGPDRIVVGKLRQLLLSTSRLRQDTAAATMSDRAAPIAWDEEARRRVFAGAR